MRAVIIACLVVTVAAGYAAGRGEAVTQVKAPNLEATARYVANHGGITGSCYGCATPRMRGLVAQLIIKRFGSYAGRALCFARRESGLNPGAISASDDHGAFQVHRASYHPFDYWRLDHDPVYSVAIGWVVSDHGTNWGPWAGGRYAC